MEQVDASPSDQPETLDRLILPQTAAVAGGLSVLGGSAVLASGLFITSKKKELKKTKVFDDHAVKFRQTDSTLTEEEFLLVALDIMKQTDIDLFGGLSLLE